MRESTPASTTSTVGLGGIGARAEDVFLSVRDLQVHFPTDDGLVKSVDGLSFDLAGARPWASSASPAPASP
jgi:peptide/nickel transport system ATP-binding protein